MVMRRCDGWSVELGGSDDWGTTLRGHRRRGIIVFEPAEFWGRPATNTRGQQTGGLCQHRDFTEVSLWLDGTRVSG